jgi:hypothetical protein
VISRNADDGPSIDPLAQPVRRYRAALIVPSLEVSAKLIVFGCIDARKTNALTVDFQRVDISPAKTAGRLTGREKNRALEKNREAYSAKIVRHLYTNGVVLRSD